MSEVAKSFVGLSHDLMKKGGHFASLEQPDLLVKDIFSFKKKCF